MPTYLYECENCGRFEKFQNIKDEALKKCPECGSEVKRIIGSPGILFKGSNFYVNQAKNDSSKSDKKDHKAS
ncbi:FmdB family transcriptional regulator [Halanaerobium sp. Z-7514]|uniref:FmdB family transcriptional regulator n=1 Tax=Halanaerobium polyolivorans TaxID=2886943 RepID=A0AAW4X265_9FIRM|nr:FmdB family zinc ribbon protein [Halanaerobium polyolivorans]MCC3145900.1 FmdB family transcriptional regulator [Halanaerobium polyolivorans]RQD77125.1 MAG: FmdB family transcriptional regulator [Halanaerobium sp. MSAO_Bac5]